MIRRPWLSSIIGVAIVAPSIVLADVPPALDRVPADAPVVVSMKNIGQFYTSIQGLATSLKVPPSAMKGLGRGAELLNMQGLNADGSAAIAIMSMEESTKPPLVMVIPVKDYAAWAKALGGQGSGVEQITFEKEPAFVKDLGGGFAAMGPQRELLDKVTGKTGSGAAFETMMGATGKAITDASDTIVIANIQALAPKIREGYGKMKDQVAGAAAMAGGGKVPNMAVADAAMEGFLRDATAGVMGFKAAEGGVKMDFGAQFKEGSPAAGYFNSKGKASSLAAALPNQPFLLAFALDTSAPGLRDLLKQAAELGGKGKEGMMAGLNPLQNLEKTDGVAFSWGASPALMGGMFLNTSSYIKTSDPAGVLKNLQDTFSGMNGKNVEGITFQTSYEAGGNKVGDKAVDVWGMRMQVDQNNPAAAQIGQMQMMLFGPSGLSGYTAQTENGVVFTYSKNSDLMQKALDAAKSGNGLTNDAGIKAVAANLPADRTGEGYIGVKSIMETALGVMSMMGAGPGDFKVPSDLPPVGLGMTTSGGGMRTSMFIPTQVLTTIKSLTDSMNKGGEEEAEPAPAEKAGQPKF